MKNFHKAASELSEDEFNSEMEQLDILSRQVVEIFFLLPLPFIPSAVISDLQVVQTCLCKLRARIKQYEDINLRPVNPIASGTSISPPPQLTDEEDFLHPESSSPPFEPSLELWAPESLVFSRSNSYPSRVLPDPIPPPAIVTELHQTPQLPSPPSSPVKSKFVFKKTGLSNPTVTIPRQNISRSNTCTSIKNYFISTVSGDGNKGYSSVNNYNRTSLANSWSGVPARTQVSEDFQTQVQGNNIEYTNKLNNLNNKDRAGGKKSEINVEGKFIGSARNDGKDPELCKQNFPHSKSVMRLNLIK